MMDRVTRMMEGEGCNCKWLRMGGKNEREQLKEWRDKKIKNNKKQKQKM